MIRPGVHHVTTLPAIVVTCDTPGCLDSAYLDHEFTIYTAEIHMKDMGWEVGNSPPLRPGVLSASCPAHASRPAVPCPHDYRERVMLGKRETCRHCGRATNRTGIA